MLIVKKPAPKEPAPADAKAPAVETKNTVAANVAAGVLSAMVPLDEFTVITGYSHQLKNGDWMRAEIRIKRSCVAKDFDAAYTKATEDLDAKLGDRVTEMLAADEAEAT